jgi:hypothetical protein
MRRKNKNPDGIDPTSPKRSTESEIGTFFQIMDGEMQEAEEVLSKALPQETDQGQVSPTGGQLKPLEEYKTIPEIVQFGHLYRIKWAGSNNTNFPEDLKGLFSSRKLAQKQIDNFVARRMS